MLQFGQRTIDIANRMNWPLDAIHAAKLVKQERMKPAKRECEAAFAAARTKQLKEGYEETGYCDWVERARQQAVRVAVVVAEVRRECPPSARKHLDVIRDVQRLEDQLRKKKAELTLYSQASTAHDSGMGASSPLSPSAHP